MTGPAERSPRFDGMHQPPNASELREHPPSGAECARMRGLMRDFVDGDLGPVTAAEVEEHVHGCRDCGLALARSEHELLQVRRIFRAAEGRRPAAVNPGFGDEVVRILMQDGTLDPEGGRGTEARQRARISGASLSMLGSLLVGAVLLTLLVVLQGVLPGSDTGAPHYTARLVITSSVDAHGVFGNRHLQLTPGAGLGDDQLILVGADGAAQADWHDATAKTQPAATFQMGGNAAMQLRNGEPMLVAGELRVDARRPVQIRLGDGSRLDLGIGRYLLTAQEAGLDGPWNAHAGAPGDLRVGIEVVFGDGAHILRDGGAPIFVGPGSVGVYSGGWSDVQRSPQSQGGIVRGPDPIGVGDVTGSFSGLVWQRNGMPAAGVDVMVSYLGGGNVHPVATTVAGSGFFRFEIAGPGHPPAVESPFAVVQVLPPAHRHDLALTAPEAYRVALEDLDARVIGGILCDVSTPLVGVVVDEVGHPQFGVRLVPCVVDDLLGAVLPWGEGQTVTDSQGAYRLTRLPATLPRHQSLVVVLVHPDFEATVVRVPVRGSEAAQRFSGEMVIRSMRAARVQQLPPNATVQIWQDTPGLLEGSAAQVHTAQTNAEGVIDAVRLGRGRVWLRNSSPAHPMLRELLIENAPGELTYSPSPGASRPFGAVFDPHQVLPGTALALAGTYRHQQLGRSGAGVAGGLDMILVDTSGSGVPTAQVFTLQASGARGRAGMRFVGFTSMAGGLRFEARSEDLAVVAIAADGAVAMTELAMLRERHGLLVMSGTGIVQLAPDLRPPPAPSGQIIVVILQPMQSVPNLRPTLHRFATDLGNWKLADIPAGHYRVTVSGSTYEVEVVAGEITIVE